MAQQVGAGKKRKGGGRGRQTKRSRTATASSFLPLNRSLETKLKSVSAQPSACEEAVQSSPESPQIVLAIDLVGQSTQAPQVQFMPMSIESPSLLQFMENQEMPHVDLDVQSDSALIQPAVQ